MKIDADKLLERHLELEEQHAALLAAATALVRSFARCARCREEGRPDVRATAASYARDTQEPVCRACSCVGDARVAGREELYRLELLLGPAVTPLPVAPERYTEAASAVRELAGARERLFAAAAATDPFDSAGPDYVEAEERALPALAGAHLALARLHDDAEDVIELLLDEVDPARLFHLADTIDELARPRCRKCGCTDDDACLNDDGSPCSWVEDNLCSACAGTPAREVRHA